MDAQQCIKSTTSFVLTYPGHDTDYNDKLSPSARLKLSLFDDQLLFS